MNKVIKLYGEANDIEKRLKFGLGKEIDYELEEDNFDIRLSIFDASNEDIIKIEQLLDDEIYNTEDVTLQQTLVEFLSENNLTIATAESCTGGLLASKIVEVSGSSEIFYEGIIAYSNSSKQHRLEVKKDTLINYGAVSEETALEMAIGVIGDKVNIGISTTGIAGPKGGSYDKPVGLVYIAIASDNKREAFKYFFKGGRQEIREKTANTALFNAFKHILKFY